MAAWELAMMQKAEIVGIACMIGLLDVMEDSDAYHALSDICSISTMLNFTNTELRSKYEADKALGNIFTNH